jgi:hypothetical protein
MNQKWTLVLALAAGFVGSALFHALSLVSVHAQAPNAPTKEVRAQSFVLVDDNNKALGRFAIRYPASPSNEHYGFGYIQLFDSSGNELFTAGGMRVRPASHYKLQSCSQIVGELYNGPARSP